jgi:hypothetical protein
MVVKKKYQFSGLFKDEKRFFTKKNRPSAVCHPGKHLDFHSTYRLLVFRLVIFWFNHFSALLKNPGG